MLRFVMTSAERLTILLIEIRASSTSGDDLVDVERTFAPYERRPSGDDATAVAFEDSGSYVGALALFCSTLLRARAERGSTFEGRAASKRGTAANHPFRFRRGGVDASARRSRRIQRYREGPSS
jgi:hypothetical protein